MLWMIMYAVKSMFILADTITTVSGLNQHVVQISLYLKLEQRPPIWKTEEMQHFLKTIKRKDLCG